MGWFLYLGSLVPVLGLFQVGPQAMADRYTYLPLIGIYVMAAWGLSDLVSRRPGLLGAAHALDDLGRDAYARHLVRKELGVSNAEKGPDTGHDRHTDGGRFLQKPLQNVRTVPPICR